MLSSFLLMYLAVSTVETIISHTSLENQFRHFVREKIDDLSHLISLFAQKSILLLERLADILKEDRYYFYFDGQQFIPSPEFTFSINSHFIERITHSNLVELLSLNWLV
ncbi:hypothetical protein [Polynucleobacter rarus]|uniref:hypothetical protein n=1 Tax=Polynucleobacter rarus TaxID=556055 RepID=UPI00131F0D9E|nr:hypothetical protein [Polynucleobacter rarus]